jgi:hypothetical protein
VILGWIFLWFGACEIGRLAKVGPVAPFHSTNRYFAPLVGDPAGSEHLLRAISLLPENEAVAVIYRDEEVSDTFLAFIVTYFAWPRPVKSLPINPSNLTSQIQALQAARISATFFCGVKPPPELQPLVRIGDGLTMALRQK